MDELILFGIVAFILICIMKLVANYISKKR
jgi:hypothetical protein